MYNIHGYASQYIPEMLFLWLNWIATLPYDFLSRHNLQCTHTQCRERLLAENCVDCVDQKQLCVYWDTTRCQCKVRVSTRPQRSLLLCTISCIKEYCNTKGWYTCMHLNYETMCIVAIIIRLVLKRQRPNLFLASYTLYTTCYSAEHVAFCWMHCSYGQHLWCKCMKLYTVRWPQIPCISLTFKPSLHHQH